MSELVVPDDLTNARFIKTEDRLSYFSAQRAVVCAGAYDEEFQLCQIVFGKHDGSIYVSAPYFPRQEGILSHITIPESPPHTVSLRERGRVTSHLVKYSHHPDGHVHFSQKGKIRTEIRAQSFPLSTSIGSVFELHVYWPGGFRPLKIENRRRERLYLRNKFRGALPSALTVSAQWRRKASIFDNADRPDGTFGLISKVQHRATGEEGTVQLIGQPDGFPLCEHLLFLDCYASPPLDSISGTTMIMTCGWNPHEKKGDDEVKRTECLIWMYPVASLDKLRQAIGSIDIDTSAI